MTGRRKLGIGLLVSLGSIGAAIAAATAPVCTASSTSPDRALTVIARFPTVAGKLMPIWHEQAVRIFVRNNRTGRETMVDKFDSGDEGIADLVDVTPTGFEWDTDSRGYTVKLAINEEPAFYAQRWIQHYRWSNADRMYVHAGDRRLASEIGP